MAGRAVGVRLEVADEIVMGERHRGDRREVRHEDERENHAQPGPGNCHLRIIRPRTGHLLTSAPRSPYRRSAPGRPFLTTNDARVERLPSGWLT